jgi:nitrite reductase/ring-hydroxylating ferredoxin subunit
MPLRTHLRTVARRDVLTAVINLSWIVPLGMSLLALFKFLRYEPPTAAPTKFVVNNASSLPRLPAYMESGQVWLHLDDRGYYAVDAICTHLGCTIRNNPDDDGYFCRCHGSRFNAEGGVVNGPATKPLRFVKLSWDQSQQMIVDRIAEVDSSFRLPPA